MRLVGRVGRKLERQPQIGHRIGPEFRPRHAQHGIGLAAQGDRVAHDVCIASVLAFPQPITQHRHIPPVRRVFLCGECPSQHHGRAKQPKVRLRHVHPVHLFGNRSGQVEPFAAEVVGGHVPKDILLLLPYVEFGSRRTRPLPLRRGQKELHDSVRIGITQRLQQNRVDDREDCRVCPDAQGERGHYGKCESGVLREHAQRMFEVRKEIIQESTPDEVFAASIAPQGPALRSLVAKGTVRRRSDIRSTRTGCSMIRDKRRRVR